MSLHSNQTGASNHVTHAFTYANKAARLAAALAATDVGKDAFESDTKTFWKLTDHSPMTWVQIGAGGSGGSFVWYLPATNSPFEDIVAGLRVLDFDPGSAQEVWAIFSVPDEYSGYQIGLKGGLYACSAVAGNVFFKALTYLIKEGSTVLGTHSNSEPSDNTEKTVPGVASQIDDIGDLILTDADGEINSVAVAPGDQLLIKLFRDTGSESSSAAGDARLIRDSFRVSLG